tara:strand:+ start:49697 stop:49918 length:222 start_codon:yes stop_codon:yes gene_type:complete
MSKWKRIDGNWYYSLWEYESYPYCLYRIKSRGRNIKHNSTNKKYILKVWERYKNANSFEEEFNPLNLQFCKKR